MSNQYPTTPPPGPVNRQPASPMIEHLPRGFSTRANLLAFVVLVFFGTIAYAFASIGRYVHFGYWRLVWVAVWYAIGLVAAIACTVLFAVLRGRKRRAEAEGKTSSSIRAGTSGRARPPRTCEDAAPVLCASPTRASFGTPRRGTLLIEFSVTSTTTSR